MVYLTSAGHDSGYILRIGRDGRDKVGGASVPAIHNATADRSGLIAGAHGHFSHQVALYDREFRKVQAVTDFLVSDQAGWDAAGGVEVGASGDFYGLDQHRDRILRIRADGKVVQAYSLPHWEKCPVQGFRVCEPTQALYLLYWGRPQVSCVGFDGKLRWERPAGCGTNTYDGDSGGFDVDAGDTLYTIGAWDSVIRKIGPDGQPAGQIKLDIPAERKPVGGIHGLRLWQGEALFARPSSHRAVPGVRSGHRPVSAVGEHRPRAADRSDAHRAVARRRPSRFPGPLRRRRPADQAPLASVGQALGHPGLSGTGQ